MKISQLFTLIELIVVIAVLGILAAIIIPNISSFQEEANDTAILSNTRNLQTGVDMYALDHYGSLPKEDITPFEPYPLIDFEELHPEYIRDLPETPNAKYWIDSWGIVWGSTVDAPKVSISNGVLSWNSNSNGLEESYNVYEVEGYTGSEVLSSVHKEYKLKFILNTTDLSIDGNLPDSKITIGKAYVVSAVDSKGFETAPVGENYQGYPENNDGSNEDLSSQYNYITEFPEVNHPVGEFIVSDSNYHDLHPQVSGDGSVIVWVDTTDYNYSIYGKVLNEDNPFSIGVTTTRDITIGLSADGQMVSWGTLYNLHYKGLKETDSKRLSASGERFSSSWITAKGEKIFFTKSSNINGNANNNVLDVATGNFEGAVGKGNPSITGDGSMIAWHDYYDNIYLKKANGQIETVEEHYFADRNAFISSNGSIIAWQRHNNGQWDIFTYNVHDKTKNNITNEPNIQINPVVSADGNIIIWEDYRNGNADIYGYNIATQEEFIVTTHTSDQKEPVISADGKLVVWQDLRNGNWDIYAKNISEHSTK